MINWLQNWLQNEDTKLMYILALILLANVIDFAIGWLNAKFNKNVQFSSSKAIYGIARKIVLFILCVYFIPVALLVPHGIIGLYILFTGYLVSEINSILNHLKLTDDDKSVEPFASFIRRIFGGNNNNSSGGQG